MRSLESFLSEVPFSPIDAISVTTPTSGQNKIYEIWTLAVRLSIQLSLLILHSFIPDYYCDM